MLVLDVEEVGGVDHRFFGQKGVHRLRAIVPVGAIARQGCEADRVIGVPRRRGRRQVRCVRSHVREERRMVFAHLHHRADPGEAVVANKTRCVVLRLIASCVDGPVTMPRGIHSVVRPFLVEEAGVAHDIAPVEPRDIKVSVAAVCGHGIQQFAEDARCVAVLVAESVDEGILPERGVATGGTTRVHAHAATRHGITHLVVVNKLARPEQTGRWGAGLVKGGQLHSRMKLAGGWDQRTEDKDRSSWFHAYISVVREGQQIGVWMKKFETLAPACIMCSIVKGIAPMEPSRRSWSSVNRKIMFFCVPGVHFLSGGGGFSGGVGASSARA